MPLTLGELQQRVGGELRGDPDTLISSAEIVREVKPGGITLVDRTKLLPELAKSCAAAAVVASDCPEIELPCLAVSDVHAAFGAIVEMFRPKRRTAPEGFSTSARIDPSAKIGSRVSIGPLATIGPDCELADDVVIHAGVHLMGGCKIAPGVVIFPNAVLYENTVVGANTIIHAGAVLGAYGFGYRLVEGKQVLSSQLGHVEIGANVEIGAGTTIDRGTYGATSIGDGTKIDNQVMIGHNCRIGKHNLLCSQVGIAGSTTTGDYVVMAGQAGVKDHVRVGDKVMLGAKAGVMNDIPDPGGYLGSPAIPEREMMLIVASMMRLPELRKEIKELARKMGQVENAVAPPVAKPEAA
jgi:UDP-3-O-[3-hydroxymyristoyl] glucosamine N-acyltransferase